MTFRTEAFVTRDMVRAEPRTLWVFGDNMRGTGYGGQARAMRGEHNAIGIPTKWLPSMSEASFFTDDDYDIVARRLDLRFDILSRHIEKGGDVVWPADGIGTGRAELQKRSPLIWTLIETWRVFLEKKANAGPSYVAKTDQAQSG